MKKQLLGLALMLGAVGLNAQSTRLSVYEEFTGETCPPCAAANPALNALLALPTNTPKVIALKWQVPIPTAPTATWSLYQTNKTEINWRYQASGYGYGINSAPSGKMDGQNVTFFGAASNHPNSLNSTVISTAQSYTTPFSISVNRAWDATYSALNVTVNIASTAAFTAVGNLVCRVVMIERKIHFDVQPGTNGEKDFEDVVIKSFPTLQLGTSMASNWVASQTQSFTLNCPIPSYYRDKQEIAIVAFIQDDGDKKIWQAGVADKESLSNDAKAVSVSLPNMVCTSSIAPSVVISNHGNNAITALTITPYIDGVAQTPVNLTTNLGVGSNTTVGVGVLNVTSGAHTFSYNVTGVSGGDVNLANNGKSISFVVNSSYQATPVAEGFTGSFPPANWSVFNNLGSPVSWIKFNNAGGFGLTMESTKLDFFNTVQDGRHDLNLPPMNLTGTKTPTLTFDVAYTYFNNSFSDTLNVYTSTDCGASWTNVYSKGGSVLMTASASQTTAFTPSATQWRKESIALTGMNTNSVLVKFEGRSGYGNNLYIDNVNLRQTDAVGVENISNSVLSVEVYPNPASNNVTLSIPSLNAGKAEVSIVNTLGQVVYSSSTRLEMGSNALNVDVKDFATGVYNVMISTANGSTVKKLNVTH